MGIKNVIFDVGDVLIHFRYMDYMKDLGLSDEEIRFFAEQMVLTDFWHEMDLGIYNNEDARKHFTEAFPQYADEIGRFWDGIADIVREYDYAKPLVQKLKSAGLSVYALSNYPDEMSDMHWAKFQFLPEMDGYIISAKEKLAKPDPAIYRLLTERFGLDLSECVFVDDRDTNVEAANSLGMKGILFTGYDNMIGEFKKLDIKID